MNLREVKVNRCVTTFQEMMKKINSQKQETKITNTHEI